MGIEQLELYAAGKKNVGIVTLTAEEALFICEHMCFERQRNLDLRHVGALADQVKHGNWIGMPMMLSARCRRDSAWSTAITACVAKSSTGAGPTGPCPGIGWCRSCPTTPPRPTPA